jgi:hypothetical protein
VTLIALAGLTSCGLESDGSRKTQPGAAVEAASQVGRYRAEPVRKGVSRALLVLIDTATGAVLQRPLLGAQSFKPVAEELAPGANLDPKIPGRFDVQLVPGRGGSALLRLDTVTGKSWMVRLNGPNRRWQALRSAHETAPAAIPKAATNAAAPKKSVAQVDRAAGKLLDTTDKQLKTAIEVLTQPGYELELQVWTAQHLASVFPVEAAALLATDLKAADPKIVIAIIEGFAFDPGGKVRATLKSLESHADAKVAAAARKRLNSSS